MLHSSNTTAIALMFFILWAGHLAGFFFAWTNPAMMGMAQASPAAYVETMQEINRAVQNPLFFMLFFGMIPVALAAVAFTRIDPLVTLAACLCIGGFLVTVIGNVPMNETMDRWDVAFLPSDTEIEAFRARWEMLNTTRAVLLTLAVGLAVTALSPLYELKSLLPERGPSHAM